MGKEKRGPLALEEWAKQLIDRYPGVSVRNMTTSWLVVTTINVNNLLIFLKAIFFCF